MKIPTGCHDCDKKEMNAYHQDYCCHAGAGYKVIAGIRYLKLIGSHVESKTFHPSCPHKEKWDMQRKLQQL